MIINQFRTYHDKVTTSDVFVNGVYFGEAIEDIGRPAGVKIPAETCIPEGVYHVSITMSGKFGKPMMVLYNVNDDHSVDRGGVRFTGIRVHRGAGTRNTEGCVLLPDYEQLQAKVQAQLDSGDKIYWVISEAIT